MRGLESQLYNKANELQEDISMKKFDLRAKQIHLAAVKAQVGGDLIDDGNILGKGKEIWRFPRKEKESFRKLSLEGKLWLESVAHVTGRTDILSGSAFQGTCLGSGVPQPSPLLSKKPSASEHVRVNFRAFVNYTLRKLLSGGLFGSSAVVFIVFGCQSFGISAKFIGNRGNRDRVEGLHT